MWELVKHGLKRKNLKVYFSFSAIRDLENLYILLLKVTSNKD